jgi:CheY-like chemotaxis protein
VVVLVSEPIDALDGVARHSFQGFGPEHSKQNLELAAIMQPVSDGMPNDVLIVEDDPIIALDFEDTLLGFGVKTVRTAGTVARALALIDQQPPDFALLDVSLIREKSFAVAERLEALGIPYAFVTGHGAEARLPSPFAGKLRLPKPYSSEALLALLTGAVDRRESTA